MESLDSETHSIAFNSYTGRPDPDDYDGQVFHMVVSCRNPGVLNWVDTCGHRHGIMGARFVHVNDTDAKTYAPKAKVICCFETS